MIISFIIAFAAKFLLVFIVAAVFYGKRPRVAESFVCGWLVTYESLIALMLILSSFKMMNRCGLLIGGSIVLLIAIAFYRKYGCKQCLSIFCGVFWDKIRKGDIINYVVAGGFILLSLFIIGHNSLFFDSTWDAHVYQVPRIELFAQKASLFVNMNCDVINIFSNEWNGELNAIFYTIICRTNQGMFLANAENFIYSLLVVCWFCDKTGIKRENTILAVTWYCSMPIVVFLTMVVKGDFVVIPFFLATVIWLKDYIETQDKYSLFFLIMGGALAAGSKISMVPFFGLCFISVFVYLVVKEKGKVISVLRYIGSIWKVLLVSIICVFISCARYLLNFLYFGEPFKRVESANEKIAISWQYLKTSAIEMAKTLVNCDNMFTHEGNVDALNLDMGMVGTAFVFLIFPTVIIWLFMCRKDLAMKIKSSFFVWFPIAGSLLFFMSSTMWFPWSFRYYIPWILVFVFYWIIMLQKILDNLPYVVKNIVVSIGIWLGIIGIASTVILATKDGEVTHSTWKEAKQKPMIEREYGFHLYLLESYDGSPDIYDFFDQIRSGKRVLICNAVNTAVSYLFGEDNTNDVTFCLPEELYIMLSDGEYDVVSISDVFLTPEMEAYFGSNKWSCYTPSKDIVQAHVYIRLQ